jgi:small-conductance mechanosensitive channel
MVSRFLFSVMAAVLFVAGAFGLYMLAGFLQEHVGDIWAAFIILVIFFTALIFSYGCDCGCGCRDKTGGE